ncbi:MAG TPA: IS481 family transposase [Thermoleophilaceae bacterium]|nr:IS481 family transposase [Thermoleophilaceae bacterium]
MTQVMERPRRKRLSWESRCEIVALIEAGMSPPLAAARGGASRATGYRLLSRYRAGGWAALCDRPSRPKRQPRRLCAEAEQAILAARRRSAYGPVRLAGLVPHPPSTIGKVLRRHGCSRLPRPEGAARCARRYERERPGELLHVDTKKLGRFWQPGKRVLGEQVGRPHKNRRVGWEYLHVAIDDHSRLAYAELLAGQDAQACVRFLERAQAWYGSQGVVVERVLSDNAKAYHSRAWVEATRRLGLERRYTRAYRPRTNGKAEGFIQTLLVEWAYARSYSSSSARARALPGYLRWYNRRRPHSSLGARPPISRVSHLCGHDS